MSIDSLFGPGSGAKKPRSVTPNGNRRFDNTRRIQLVFCSSGENDAVCYVVPSNSPDEARLFIEPILERDQTHCFTIPIVADHLDEAKLIEPVEFRYLGAAFKILTVSISFEYDPNISPILSISSSGK